MRRRHEALRFGIVPAGCAGGVWLSGGQRGAPLFIGPLPYLSSADSPFDLSAVSSGHFYFEDFEDGVLNVPVVITTDPADPPTGPRGPSPVYSREAMM